ncbi:MAG: cell division protein FtsZ, partial [Desulfonatronovibrionaceae bacterium]
AMKAITSPLLEDVSIDGARGVLMNVTCGPDLAIDEVSEAAEIIHEAAHEDAQIYFGTVFDEGIEDEIRITVIATGIEDGLEKAVENNSNVTRIDNRKQQGNRLVKRPRSMNVDSESRENLNIPTYLRSSKSSEHLAGTAGNSSKSSQKSEEFIFDEDEFEIPSFIRRQAD